MQGFPVAVFIGDGNGEAVGIGVVSNDEFGIFFFG